MYTTQKAVKTINNNNEINNKCNLQWHFHRVALHLLIPSWNLEVLIFAEEGKTGGPGEKPSKQGSPTNQQLYSHNRTRAHRGVKIR
jgi:hypothetical protein